MHRTGLGVAVFKDLQRTRGSGQLEHFPLCHIVIQSFDNTPTFPPLTSVKGGTIDGFERKGPVLGTQFGGVHTLCLVSVDDNPSCLPGDEGARVCAAPVGVSHYWHHLLTWWQHFQSALLQGNACRGIPAALLQERTFAHTQLDFFSLCFLPYTCANMQNSRALEGKITLQKQNRRVH